jgi:hypothetical protein
LTPFSAQSGGEYIIYMTDRSNSEGNINVRKEGRISLRKRGEGKETTAGTQRFPRLFCMCGKIYYNLVVKMEIAAEFKHTKINWCPPQSFFVNMVS